MTCIKALTSVQKSMRSSSEMASQKIQKKRVDETKVRD